MMLRAHTCAHARASSGTMRSAFVRVLYAALRQAVGDLRARSRRTPYMPLCTRSEVYIRLVCPGIGLSQGAADDARRQGAGLRLNTQLVVSLLSKVLWVGLSLKSSRMRLLVSYRPLACACQVGNQVPRSGDGVPQTREFKRRDGDGFRLSALGGDEVRMLSLPVYGMITTHKFP